MDLTTVLWFAILFIGYLIRCGQLNHMSQLKETLGIAGTVTFCCDRCKANEVLSAVKTVTVKITQKEMKENLKKNGWDLRADEDLCNACLKKSLNTTTTTSSTTTLL